MKMPLDVWVEIFLKKSRMTSSETWLIFQRKLVIVKYDLILHINSDSCKQVLLINYLHMFLSGDCGVILICGLHAKQFSHFAFIIQVKMYIWKLTVHCFIWQINEFVKRARAAKIHAYIISHLKKEMPSMIGKAKAQQKLMDKLEAEFAKVLLNLYVFNQHV